MYDLPVDIKRYKVNPLRANPTKWSDTLKLFVDCCRRVAWVCVDYFVGFALKGLKHNSLDQLKGGPGLITNFHIVFNQRMREIKYKESILATI